MIQKEEKCKSGERKPSPARRARPQKKEKPRKVVQAVVKYHIVRRTKRVIAEKIDKTIVILRCASATEWERAVKMTIIRLFMIRKETEPRVK